MDVDALYTLDPKGRYHYTKGYNPVAIGATLVGAVVGVIVVFALSCRGRHLHLVHLRRDRIRRRTTSAPRW